MRLLRQLLVFAAPWQRNIPLFRASDGQERQIPDVPAFQWNMGQHSGLVITDKHVWIRATHPGGGDVHHIVRFEIDNLPVVEGRL